MSVVPGVVCDDPDAGDHGLEQRTAPGAGAVRCALPEATAARAGMAPAL